MSHHHTFVETYTGLVGYGLNRNTNEATVMYYLQKFTDDSLLQHLIPRLNDEELTELFDYVSGLLKKHLTENDYHRLFLKDEPSQRSNP